MTRAWDDEIRNCLFELASAECASDPALVASLPLRLGGLGLVRQELVAPFAFAASADAALRPQNCSPFAAPQPSQADACADLFRRVAADAPPHLHRLLAENRVKGASDWLSYEARGLPMGKRACSAALRLRIGAVAAQLPATKSCPGCARVFPRAVFEYHASGCAALGVPVMKHNSVRDLCEQFALEAGHSVVHEPREYQAYRCRQCGDVLSKREAASHTCAGHPDRTGVDFRVLFPEGAAVYDVTVLQALAPSYGDTAPEALVARVDRKKHGVYDEQCASNAESLEHQLAGNCHFGVFL